MKIEYKGFILSLCKRTALDGMNWFCIVNETNNRKVIAKFKLKRDAVWNLQNFEQRPIFPL